MTPDAWAILIGSAGFLATLITITAKMVGLGRLVGKLVERVENLQANVAKNTSNIDALQQAAHDRERAGLEKENARLRAKLGEA